MLAGFEAPMPAPVGVFYATSRPTFDTAMNAQLAEAKSKQGAGDIAALLKRGDVWTVN
jgi:2-oxoglutarate ferredoxin oxidoreductase subunit beta